MAQAAPVCVVNLGPRQARKRLVFGVAFLASGLLGGAALRWFDLSAGWQLCLFIPYGLGLLGVLQARTRT